MLDFIISILPWVCIGMTVATLVFNRSAKKKISESDNYMIEGMCAGMCIGLLLGGNGLSYGMFIGLILGMSIKKNR